MSSTLTDLSSCHLPLANSQAESLARKAHLEESNGTKISKALEKCEIYASNNVCELENQFSEARENSLRAELALDESLKKAEEE